MGWDLIICQLGRQGDDAQRCESHSHSFSCNLFARAHIANGTARKCRTLVGYIRLKLGIFPEKRQYDAPWHI